MFLLFSLHSFGQSLYRNDLAVAFGEAIPTDGRYPLYDNRSDLTAAYGFRFSRLFQADVAFDTVFHPTGTILGPGGYDTKDHLYVAQFGGRIVFPVGQRLTFGFGAGPAFFHYSTVENQAIGQLGFNRWGFYVLGSAKFSLDHGGHFYIGSTPKFLGTNGTSIGRFFVLGGDFGVRFMEDRHRRGPKICPTASIA